MLFFVVFFIKIKIVDTNKHNVPVFSTVAELDCYKKKKKRGNTTKKSVIQLDPN